MRLLIQKMKVRLSSVETPLQEKLETLADSIGKFGLTFAVITFLALMIRMIINITAKGEHWDNNKHPALIVKAIIIAVVSAY